jgi:hypothetical protein
MFSFVSFSRRHPSNRRSRHGGSSRFPRPDRDAPEDSREWRSPAPGQLALRSVSKDRSRQQGERRYPLRARLFPQFLAPKGALLLDKWPSKSPIKNPSGYGLSRESGDIHRYSPSSVMAAGRRASQSMRELFLQIVATVLKAPGSKRSSAFIHAITAASQRSKPRLMAS